jgi:hypothetical protein
MYFWYISHVYAKIHMYHIFYMKCTVLLVFSLCFTAKTYTSSTFHMYTKIHMYHIFYKKCTVLLVFSCVFTVFSLQKHELLIHFTWIYQNTHVPYIPHEMHCFPSVFMCFHCVFTAEICFFGTFHMLIPKYTWTMYSTWNALFCLCFHVCSLCFHCRNSNLWYISHEFTKIHMYHIFYMKCTVSLVFSLCFHCKNIDF